MRSPSVRWLAVLSGMAFASSAGAQVISQTITLQTGWNNVFLEIDPAPTSADVVFAGQPISTVWAYEPAPAQPLPADCDGPNAPDCPPPAKGRWLLWVPSGHPAVFVKTLSVLSGGRALLIEASAPTTFAITGVPHAGQTAWRRGYNLQGFYVRSEPNTQPTFTGYLSSSPVLASATVWATQAASQAPIQVGNLNTPIGYGAGYWVSAPRDTVHDGPVRLDALSSGGINFGKGGLNHQLSLENLSSTARTITILHQVSLPVSVAGVPDYAGDTPLHRLSYGSGSLPQEIFQHPALGSHVMSLDSAAQSNGRPRGVMRVEINRVGLAPAVVDADGNGSVYQSYLELTDNSGWRRKIPVQAQVLGSTNVGGSNPLAGLWVGDVSVSGVNWVTAPLTGDTDGVTPRPVGSPFVFRVIIHSDANGVCKLLTEVTLLYENGIAGDPNHEPPIPDTPGHYVLATSSCGAPCNGLTAGNIVDGEPFARRISTAAYSFAGDLVMDGALAIGDGLAIDLTVAEGDPHNPFRHRYHPDHDGTQPGEVYTITRSMVLSFDSARPQSFGGSGWGDQVLTGQFSENVNGLHRDTINVAGTFTLRRVSTVAALNNS